MEKLKAIFKKAWPYQDDAMQLPVTDLAAAIPFYETIMGFRLVLRKDSPVKSAEFSRDDIQIGLAENGEDPTQDGCFFEVDNLEKALMELKGNGLTKELTDIKPQMHGTTSWKVFFIVSPNGLCYCLGERQKINRDV